MRKLTHDEIGSKRLPAGSTPDPATLLPLWGMLDNIRSLYNVGSMFRTADAAGVRHLYLCGYTPAPPRKEINKTALGAADSVPWTHDADPLRAIRAIKAQGIRLCVLEQTTSSRPVYELRPEDFPLCLVVGNELTGVSPQIIAEADLAVDIPMLGMKHSLNAAVAFGVAMFECVRVLTLSPFTLPRLRAGAPPSGGQARIGGGEPRG
jgi:23S rRNA (guanosine2251-2'-O)-methyltransferase